MSLQGRLHEAAGIMPVGEEVGSRCPDPGRRVDDGHVPLPGAGHHDLSVREHPLVRIEVDALGGHDGERGAGEQLDVLIEDARLVRPRRDENLPVRKGGARRVVSCPSTGLRYCK